jgi:hypothetical protein
MRSTIVRAGLIAGAAVLLTGCLQAELDMTIDEDGSAELVVTTELDFGAARDLFGDGAEGLEDFGIGSIDELIDQAMEDPSASGSTVDTEGLPDDAEVDTDTERDGDRVISTTTVSNVDYEDLNAWFEASEDDGLELTIDRDGDEWTVEGTADIQGVRDQATGDLPSEELPGDLGEGFQELLGDISIAIVATLPGGVAEHEGGEVDGSTVRWTFTPEDDDGDFSARWAPGAGGGGSSVGVIVAVVVVALLLVALVVWLIRRGRSRGSSATPGTDLPPGGAPVAAGPMAGAAGPVAGVPTGGASLPPPGGFSPPPPPPGPATPPPPPPAPPGGSDLPPPSPR